ncbi:hypothetical protein BDV95DRAFT_627038 [Massariosphaeria phaeospora]|uniref:DUF218 domain-containing protein n=1 Tax=Massariosphaeria phaeospora TaxID=100035 RepID=A0A7C8MT45_9PLEO|nr:hypothetical protein BDV95DRAFT_627038 [Massariosphaeria phaeospora]
MTAPRSTSTSRRPANLASWRLEHISYSERLSVQPTICPSSDASRSIALPFSFQTATPVSAATPSDNAAPHITTSPGLQVPEAADFTHPDHVIPPKTYAGVEDLVIVCGHAIYHPDYSNLPIQGPHHEQNWHLAPFQKSNPATGKPSEHSTFLAHITAGLDALTTSPSALKPLLVFSGAATKPALTPLSEARSYYHAALAVELAAGHHGGGRAHALFHAGRLLLEERATDSLQNLLFSILLFRRTTGAYPKRVRVVTHAFKARRFLELHARAIAWPASRLLVQGIDPVMSGVELQEVVSGEERFGYGAWEKDLLGTGEVLTRKRRERGWSGDADVVAELAEGLEDSVKALLRGSLVGVLPWSESQCEPASEDSGQG